MLDAIFTAATGKVTIIAFAVLVVATIALAIVNPKHKIREDLKSDYVSTDSDIKFRIDDIKDMLKLYDKKPERYEDGTKPEHYKAHESFILVYDLIYPLCYAIPGVLLLAHFFPVTWRGGSLRLLVLLPLLAMIFDYAENFTMLFFLRRFRLNPETPLLLLKVSRTLTVMKWGVVVIILLILLIFGARSLVRLRGSFSK